ncbi:hypothetical protein [Streptomyces sp. VRA16 Mangrove soil]|uniref:hypothetical protein n=1 Tax=Streptomyces sp. VRA16 Mangrove soil TaxID=2817434 RepID=UPI001A9D5894|nr:hypothetical protein [Streptomyces sp. VRA16 Mangrove soil]MBO1332171.1 hypothetical protein [Streptomyces sp. VRA16 Mangrove soil]
MRRSELTGGDGAWAGLELEVTGRPRPRLCPYVAEGGRLVVRRGDGAPVLLARVEDDECGVDVLRTGRHRSPLPPPRADEARQRGGDAARWAHRCADALAAAPDSPLHDGRWALRSSTRFQRWGPELAPVLDRWRERLVTGDPDGYLDWFRFNGAGEILPLRAWPEAADARVKAYRKQARDGTLPPVLLWWFSGLDAHLVLDGHARLVAALAEEREPAVLELTRLAPPDEAARDSAAAVTSYTAEMARFRTLRAAHGDRVPDGAALMGPVLARALHTARTGHRPTWAWPLPGGAATWDRWAREVLAGWEGLPG